MMRAPELAQEQEGAFGQGDVTVALALAGTEVEETAFGIHVADFQAQGFAQTQAAGVDRGQGDPLVQGRHGGQNTAHLGGGKHDGEFKLGIGADQLEFVRPDAVEGFFPEELDLPAGRQEAQMTWVEVWRASCFSVLRWRQYWRNSSAETRSGALWK